jgi:hypothetical protein
MAKLRDNVFLNDPAVPGGRACSDATINVSFKPMVKILRHRHFGWLDVATFIALA